jgi:hypothetical protein
MLITSPPPAARADAGDRPGDVRPQLAREIVVGQLVDRVRRADGGVVDEHVDATVALADRRERGSQGLGIGHVGGESRRRRPDLVGQRAEPACVARERRDVCTLGGAGCHDTRAEAP